MAQMAEKEREAAILVEAPWYPFPVGQSKRYVG
jgi:hypothetical protein